MYLGIDFGGSHVKFGAVNNNEIVAADQFSLQGMEFSEILKRTAALSLSMLDDIGISPSSDLKGVALALPGVVNSRDKKLTAINDKYIDALHFDFAEWARQHFGIEADIFNDAKMALMGEVFSGAARGDKDVSMLIIGTGIGTAVMMNNLILQSRHHTAGNLGGHFSSHASGVQCSCGNRGCVEAYASNSILHKRINETWDLSDSSLKSVERIDYQSIFDRYQTEPKARLIADSLIEHWANLVVNILHAYDSETVILSGGVFNSSIDIRSKIQTLVEQNVWLPNGSYSIKLAQRPSYSVLLGAESKKANYFMN